VSLVHRTPRAERADPDILAEGGRLVRVARQEGIALRLLGGLAVHAHAGGWTAPGPTRTYADIDCAITHRDRSALGALLEREGYRPKEPFNSLNPSRLVFYDPIHGRHVDVFVDEFEMCHRIVLAHRLDADPLTIPPAELLLTKLQVVEINGKDVQDIVTLLRALEIGDSDVGAIDGRRIAELLAGDWGLWRTATERLAAIPRAAAEMGLDGRDLAIVERRVRALADLIAARPKSVGWRIRSRVGDRRKWYLEPEEIGHGG
jgi:hypothetical protein